ncbi:MAG: hypothetical protein WDW38_010154 [Sanguina aurantia]
MAKPAEDKYVFDAPQYHDFGEASTGSRANSACERSALKEVNSSAASLLGSGRKLRDSTSKAVGASLAAAAPKPAAAKNIVTSWGANTTGRKRPLPDSGAPQTGRKLPSSVPRVRQEQRAPETQQRVASTVGRTGAARGSAAAAPSTAKTPVAKTPAAGRAKMMKGGVKVKGHSVPVRLASSARQQHHGVPPRLLAMQAHSTKALTLPQDLTLRTAKRARGPETAQAGGDEAPPLLPANSPFKPMAQRIKEFQSKTPVRFRTRPGPAMPVRKMEMTDAKEPQLMTTARARPSTLKSRQEQDEETMAAMPAFHALPANAAILQAPSTLGLPPAERRATTTVQPFNFVTDGREVRRGVSRRSMSAHAGRVGGSGVEDGMAPDPAHQQFKANPVRKSILAGTGWLPERVPHVPVVGKSPNLRTRLRSHEAKPEPVIPHPEFHARPMPEHHAPSRDQQQHPHPEGLPLTQPQPFTLVTEARGRQHHATFMARLDEEEECAREAHNMHATALPISTDQPMVPPRPEARGLTLPQPFNLLSEARHTEYLAEHGRELTQEEAEARAEAEFKARPMWRGVPFSVHDSDAPLTVPEEPHMATDGRAVAREIFDAAQKEQVRAMEAERRVLDAEKGRADAVEMRRMRSMSTFEARPMPDFSKPPPPALASTVPLTVPRAPMFTTQAKRQRH